MLGEALGGEQAGQFLSLLGPGEDARLRDGGLVTRGGERGDIAARPLGLDRAVERESSWTGRLSWLKLILSSSSNSDGRLRAHLLQSGTDVV